MANAMQLLDRNRLEAVTTESFRDAEPYPWLNPEGLLTTEAFNALRQQMPSLDVMQPSFGRKRAHGQQSHDRYALEYRSDLAVPEIWHQFIAELEGPTYHQWLSRLFGGVPFRLTYHWHYTPRGCSVSPHCDGKRKLGSHIFYFNTADDWNPEWGGETLVLDDGGRFNRNSAPDFDEFDRVLPANAMGNRSFLFHRRGDSWHGVKPLTCPEGVLRKVFIVVVNVDTLAGRIRRWFHRPEGLARAAG